MSDGSICTPEEQALFHSSRGNSIVCLTRSDTIGLTLVSESGFMSLIAVLVVFTLIFVSVDAFMEFLNLIIPCAIAK